MTTPLLPGPPARRCRCCRRLIRVGPVIDGYGIECARRRGLIPPAVSKPDSAPQDGPDLLGWRTESAPQNDDQITDPDDSSHALNR